MKHTQLEDLAALLIGTLLITVGLALLQSAQLFTGGIAGVALILHYLTGFPVGVIFVVVNVPFLVFAGIRMGYAFLGKTIAVNALLAAFTLLSPHVLRIVAVPLFAGPAGGVLVGMGILSLARHRASVGGTGVIALWAQERHGTSAGAVQMSFDVCIMLLGLFVLPTPHFLLSSASAAILSIVLVMNHKPGRYTG